MDKNIVVKGLNFKKLLAEKIDKNYRPSRGKLTGFISKRLHLDIKDYIENCIVFIRILSEKQTTKAIKGRIFEGFLSVPTAVKILCLTPSIFHQVLWLSPVKIASFLIANIVFYRPF